MWWRRRHSSSARWCSPAHGLAAGHVAGGVGVTGAAEAAVPVANTALAARATAATDRRILRMAISLVLRVATPAGATRPRHPVAGPGGSEPACARVLPAPGDRRTQKVTVG
jgi:hypothetical protein